MLSYTSCRSHFPVGRPLAARYDPGVRSWPVVVGKQRLCAVLALGCAALLAAGPAGAGAPVTATQGRGGVRLIVGLRPRDVPADEAAVTARLGAIARRSGLRLRSERGIGRRLRVLALESAAGSEALDQALVRLAADPEVDFVEADRRVYRHAVASDALFPGQWYLQSNEAAAIDATGAWNLTTGSVGTVVAVLDTGVSFAHPDLLRAGQGGRLLPGYDFVGVDPDGRFRVANDGDGWDEDPSDPGDWVSEADVALPLFAECSVEDSSWHGTRVAGIIGALTDNGTGVAGATWSPWLLPVRVLGKCFGYDSDILDGMRWAAGLHVAGVADNPYPAKIINMSLGAAGSCTAAYRSVLDELSARGVLVVASAGNAAGGPVEYPANCAGVAGVAGLRHVGTKVGFSSIGPAVALSAPGGNCVNTAPGSPCLFSLDTTTDTGRTRPASSSYTDEFTINVGTSFAAPSVAAIAALMHAVNGNLDAAALLARLREGARPFPPAPAGVAACHVPLDESDLQLECACTTDTCGAGMADAPGGVVAALRPVAAIAVPATVTPGAGVTLDASGSAAACGRAIAAYAWTAVAGAPAINGAGGPVATITAPVSGAVVLRLTVTDDQGASDFAEVTISAGGAATAARAAAGTTACPAAITPAAPAPPPAAGGGGGGGGGGALGPGWWLLLLLATRWCRRGAHP